MARPLRSDVENGLYHVTSRGWERRVMVRNDAACQQDVVQAVCNEFDVHRTDLVARRRRGNEGRLAAIWGRRHTDESVETIGDYFGGVSTPTISQAVLRVEIRRNQDRAWERQLKSLMAGSRSNFCKF